MKPTEGPWKADREEEFRFEITSQDDTHIATLDWPWSSEVSEFRELEANAALIAEAGTVYHETGLTPREILAQRDEAMAELMEIKDYLWPDQTGLPNRHRNALIAIKARANLSNKHNPQPA
jgi:hypothetical protein